MQNEVEEEDRNFVFPRGLRLEETGGLRTRMSAPAPGSGGIGWDGLSSCTRPESSASGINFFQYCVIDESGRRILGIGAEASYLLGVAEHGLAVLYNELKVGVATSECQGLGANAASNIDN